MSPQPSRHVQLLQRFVDFRDHEQAEAVEQRHLEDQAALAERLCQQLDDDIAGAVVLASPTGTGKTIIALAAALQSIDDLDDLASLAIIAPNAHVRDRWLERARVMAPDLRVRDDRRAPGRGQIAAFTVRDLHKRRSLPEHTLVILDEAHRGTQNAAGTTYQNLQRVCVDRPVLLVSATPYQLSTGGLVAMLSVNSSHQRQAELEPVVKLARRLRPIVERGAEGEQPGPEERDELARLAAAARQVVDHYLIRPNLRASPAATYRLDENSVDNIDLADPPWARAYWTARATPSLTSQRVGDSFNRAVDSSCEAFQASAVGRELQGQGENVGTLAITLRASMGENTSHPKMAATVDWVADRVKQGRHVLVFTYFRATQRALHEALEHRLSSTDVYAPTGASIPSNLVGRFRSRPTADNHALVLVVTEKFSESIDLDGGAPCVVHHDLHWNPNRIRQRMGRVTRLSTGYQVVDSADIFIPILATPTDRRLLATVQKRLLLGDLLLPAEFEAVLDDLPTEVLDALFDRTLQQEAPGSTAVPVAPPSA
jgi:superfamily II DNA or RNA helicase